MDVLPDTFRLPALQAAVGSGIVAILLRQVAPRAAGTQDIEDGVQSAAVIGTRATDPFLGREERLQDPPLGVSEVSHAPILRRHPF